MPVVACRCGKSYSLKDEFAGKSVQCPQCGNTLQVPYAATPTIKAAAQADRAFDRDVFLLRQKHFSISEKYVVWDEQGEPLLFIERPAHLGRSLLAVLAALLAAAAVATVFGLLASVMPNDTLTVIFGVLAAVGAAIVLVVVLIWLSPKRHVTFYRDQNKSERIMDVLQDQKVAIIVATYTITDAKGNLLARLRKNYLYNFFRKQWRCLAPDGTLLCVAKEDSMILSMLRRLLGPMLGLLRTNFIILERDSDRVIGEFNRKFTILDRYALDLKGDPTRALDRRIALAIGVMLDTGERR